jgi:hypothetical protein
LVRVVYQHAARELLPSQLSNVVPLVEEILEDLVGLEFFGVWIVDLPPEELGALPPCDES